MKKIIIAVMTLALCAGFVTGARAGKKSTSDAFTHERLNRSAIESVEKSEKVIAGNVEWKILDVEEVGPILRQRNTGAALETKGKFINIRLEVMNRGEEPKYIFDLRLVDHRGHTYPICAEAYAYFGPIEEACIMADLYPDVKRTFTMSYDVPMHAKDLLLEVTDLNVPPKEEKYIDLGI